MAVVVFDDDAASALHRVLSSAANLLGDQGWPRQVAVGTAVEDFTGSYARLFTHTARAEADDRGRLSGVLADLAADILGAITAAKQERQRQLDLTAWQKRDRERRRQEADGGLAGALNEVYGWFDPHPSEHPVSCPTLHPVFSPVRRTRTTGTVGGTGGGKSSADPDRLRTFVAHTEGANARLGQELTVVRNAWTRFTATCTWVPLGSVTFLAGFERYLHENQEDTTWIARIADAFQTAGGGRGSALSDGVVTLTVVLRNPRLGESPRLLSMLTGLSPDELAQAVKLNPGLVQKFWENPPPADEVATWWAHLDPVLREEWCQVVPTIIGNLPGIDAASRIHANFVQLTRDLNDPGIPADSPRGKTLRDIKKALLLDKFPDTGKDYARLATSTKPPRGLLDYNLDHVPPLAAVAIGYPAAEKRGKVTWAIPGMGTRLGDTTSTLSGWAGAGINLYRTQDHLEPGVPHLVVAWVGYDPPATPGFGQQDVLHGDRALAGAKRLARELDGQYAADTVVAGNRNPFTAVVGHSYGTTVLTDALTDPANTHPVQKVVLVASAGIEGRAPAASSLHVDGGADNVFTIQARADQLAGIARDLSGRADPASPAWGARVLSAEANPDKKLAGTDGHDAIGHGSDTGNWWNPTDRHASKDHGYFNLKTESLNNIAAASTGQDASIDRGAKSATPPAPGLPSGVVPGLLLAPPVAGLPATPLIPGLPVGVK